jgi:hypothetical protein
VAVISLFIRLHKFATSRQNRSGHGSKLDEHTVRDWQQRAGKHCQHVYGHLAENSQHDLKQAQADQIKAEPSLALRE